MLVASIADMRATMDIDTTVKKALPLNEADVLEDSEEICNIPLEDNVEIFKLKAQELLWKSLITRAFAYVLEASLRPKMFIRCIFCHLRKAEKLFLAEDNIEAYITFDI